MSRAHKSAAWRQRRERFFREYKKVCCCCPKRNPSGSPITLHHMAPGLVPIGQEEDCDLVVLCKDHHEDLEAWILDMCASGISVSEASEIFIRAWSERDDPLKKPRKKSYGKNRTDRSRRKRKHSGGNSRFYNNNTEHARRSRNSGRRPDRGQKRINFR